MPDPPDVMRIAQSDRAHAELLRPFDTEFHRFERDDLAETFAAIDGEHGAHVTHWVLSCNCPSASDAV